MMNDTSSLRNATHFYDVDLGVYTLPSVEDQLRLETGEDSYVEIEMEVEGPFPLYIWEPVTVTWSVHHVTYNLKTGCYEYGLKRFSHLGKRIRPVTQQEK
jgi:hypothetical protein